MLRVNSGVEKITKREQSLDLTLLCKRPGRREMSRGGVLSREQTRTGIYCPRMLVSCVQMVVGSWDYTDVPSYIDLAHTSTWPDMLSFIVLPGLKRSPPRSRCLGFERSSQLRNMGRSETLGLMRGWGLLTRVSLRSHMHFWTTWREVRNRWFRRRPGGLGTQRRGHSYRHSFSKWWVVLRINRRASCNVVKWRDSLVTISLVPRPTGCLLCALLWRK